MKILCIDTAVEACSVSIMYDDTDYSYFEIAPRQHNKILFQMCNQAIADAQLSLNQLDAIAFGRGPGYFTGVRIAAAFVQGVAFAHQLPVIPVSDLHMLAEQLFALSESQEVLSVIDARMGEVYYGFYMRTDNKLSVLKGEESLTSIEKIPDFKTFNGVICGNVPEICNSVTLPKAKAMHAIVKDKMEKGELCAAEEALPLYLRNQVITHLG